MRASASVHVNGDNMETVPVRDSSRVPAWFLEQSVHKGMKHSLGIVGKFYGNNAHVVLVK